MWHFDLKDIKKRVNRYCDVSLDSELIKGNFYDFIEKFELSTKIELKKNLINCTKM